MSIISVVMGVYNAAPTLEATIDSILAQTEHDFECIVIDDGSSDQTPALLKKYASADSRIRVIRQENAGLTRALITGCEAAKGRYIARHDAGDLSSPRRLEKQRQALDADPSLAFVSCATQFSGPELEPLFVNRSIGTALVPTDVLDASDPRILIDGPTHHGSVMFRKDAYERAGGYRAAFYYGQDFDLWYRLAEQGKFQSLEEVLYTARITADSISTSARERQEEIAVLSREAFFARLAGKSDAPILARAAAIRSVRPRSRSSEAAGLYFIGETLRKRRDRRATRYLLRSIARRPILLRSWVRCLESLLLWLPPRDRVV